MIHTTGAPTWLDGIDRDVPNWTGALCRESDPDLWFPNKGESGAAAKRICDRCPLKDECLNYSLQHPWLVGIWGGTSENERVRLRLGPAIPRRQAREHGTARGYRQHTYRREVPCTLCLEAKRAKSREEFKRRREAAAG